MSGTFDTMSTETVRIRALMTVGQLNLYYGDEGVFPVDQVQPLIDLGRVELVDGPKPKRATRRRKSGDDTETGTETGTEADTDAE